MSDKTKSILAMLVSTMGFSIMGLCVKLTSELPLVQRVTIRSYIVVLTSLWLMRHYQVSVKGIKHYKLLMLRSVFGTLGILLNYYAVDRLLLSDANILFRLSTFFLLVFSWVFLHERLNLHQFLAIVFAFVGVLFVIKPQMSVDLFPYLIALSGAGFAAAAYTVVRFLGPKEHPLVVVMFFSVFTALVLTPGAVIGFVPMTPLQWLLAIFAGIGASIGQVGVTYAYKHAPAKEVSIYGYFGVIFSAAFSLLVFGTLPDVYSFIGYVIIFASAYYMFTMNQPSKLKTTEAKATETP